MTERIWLIVIISSTLLSCTATPAVDLREQIKQTLELETVEFTYRSIVYYENSEKFLGIIPWGNQQLLFRANTLIRAGILLNDDFSILRDDGNSKRLYVVLPEATILSADLDEESIHQYYVSEKIRPIDFASVGMQIGDMKDDAVARSIEYGILEQAEHNARTSLRSVFMLMGFQDIHFTTSPKTDIRG